MTTERHSLEGVVDGRSSLSIHDLYLDLSCSSMQDYRRPTSKDYLSAASQKERNGMSDVQSVECSSNSLLVPIRRSPFGQQQESCPLGKPLGRCNAGSPVTLRMLRVKSDNLIV